MKNFSTKRACIQKHILGLFLLLISLSANSQTATERLATCENDVRVLSGLLSAEICAGADIFFRATFDGNGRTCATCHRVEDNFTISPDFISNLPNNDPLFVAENNPALATLEQSTFLRNFAMILENVDGLDDLTNKFTLRSIPHTLSMTTSIAPSDLDSTTTPPVERTGWSGDGAPSDNDPQTSPNGSLRDFLTGAITQHFPSDLSRTPGLSFTLPNDLELDLTLAYQLSLGRVNEIDLESLSLTDVDAQAGIGLFQGEGRCDACHRNAGANFIADGNNRNFNTGVENIRIPAIDAAGTPTDGGFGGQGLATFNFDSDNDGVNDSFGDGSFNSTPLIEAADTGPFFHTNAFTTIEDAIDFYNSPAFAASPSGQVGNPINLSTNEVNQIGRLLRVLNVAFNIDIALQRLEAVEVIIDELGRRNGVDVQLKLMELAGVELQDALEVLQGAPSTLHQTAQNSLNNALQMINNTVNGGPPNGRNNIPPGLLQNAISFATDARNDLGTGINFILGEGNLMH